MLVKVKDNLKVSPLTWYHKLIGKGVILDVELEPSDSSYYSVRNWEQFVSPFEIKNKGLCGLMLPKAHCIEPVYNLTTIDKNHLIFRAQDMLKPIHMFVVPDMTANSEATYIMNKIKSKPLKEVIQILLDSGFEIYVKFKEGSALD